MKGVQLTKLVQELGLHNLTPEIDLAEIWIKTAEINRPALQLTGYLEHFANERVQIIGYVEYTYLMQLSDEERKFKYERFISSKIPCVIFSTMTRPSQDMIDLALKYHVPTFVTERTTSSFMAEIIRWLGVRILQPVRILNLYDMPVSAGTGQFLDNDSYEEVEVGPEVQETADFGVRISGDSMMPRYLDKQIVWIQKTDELNDGEIGIFYYNGNAYCKKLLCNKKGTYLISLTDKYDPIEIAEGETFKTFGRVVS